VREGRLTVSQRDVVFVEATHEPDRIADILVGQIAGWKTGATRFMGPTHDFMVVEATHDPA
jgi:hypothetical protein